MSKNGIFDDKTGFYNLDQYIDESFIDWTGTDPDDLIKYPIEFLNDALGGISKSELVVVGADSGTGKTEYANDMAFKNAEKGKNVFLFSLEGDKYEVINRQRYKEYISMVNESGRLDMYVTYRDFIHNRVPKGMASNILDLDEMFKRKYKTLRIYNREEALNMKLFTAHLELINSKADLVVIDHLHYFDFATSNEYSEISEIMKQLKKLQDNFRVPIVLISHLRKKDSKRIFPDQYDFHGSSNIPKQADTCIAISHIEVNSEDDNKQYEEQVTQNIYKTGVRIVKCRTGFSSKIVSIIDYDQNKRQYDQNYELAICGNNYITMMERANYPKWSVNAKKFYEVKNK